MNAPVVRRRFESTLVELAYLSERVMYWLYTRLQSRPARPFAKRMNALLRRVPEQRDTIVGSRYYALVAEAEGRWEDVATHTKRQLGLIYRLRRFKGGASLVPDDYLISTIGNLATALIESGDRRAALTALKRVRTLCHQNGFPFELEWMVEEAKALPFSVTRRQSRSR